jgi:hypothetical protein
MLQHVAFQTSTLMPAYTCFHAEELESSQQDEEAAIIIKRFWTTCCIWMTEGQMGVNT